MCARLRQCRWVDQWVRAGVREREGGGGGSDEHEYECFND